MFRRFRRDRHGLIVEDFFDVADFSLSFTRHFFSDASALEFAVLGELPRSLFDFSRSFFCAAFDMIFSALFHAQKLASLGIRRNRCQPDFQISRLNKFLRDAQIFHRT